MLEGVILKGIGGFYYIAAENGVYECRARGIFRKEGIRPTVGDAVRISVLDEEKKKGADPSAGCQCGSGGDRFCGEKPEYES